MTKIVIMIIVIITVVRNIGAASTIDQSIGNEDNPLIE